MLRPDFRKERVCPKSVTKTVYWNNFFGKWMYFQISLSLWKLQVTRDLLCVRDIAEKCLNRLLLLKSSYQRCMAEKDVFKKFKNFLGKHLCWNFFNKVAGLRAFNFVKMELQRSYFPVNICEIFKNTYIEEHLWTTINEAWLEPSYTYMMELFEKTVNDLLFSQKSSIIDIWYSSKYSKLPLNY